MAFSVYGYLLVSNALMVLTAGRYVMGEDLKGGCVQLMKTTKRMDLFKLAVFRKENPEEALHLSTLSDAESRKVCNAFLQLINYPVTTTTQQLFRGIENSDRLQILYGEAITNEMLALWLSATGHDKMKKDAYLIWLQYWNYIWYDTADEGMIIFLPQENKALFITDHGYTCPLP